MIVSHDLIRLLKNAISCTGQTMEKEYRSMSHLLFFRLCQYLVSCLISIEEASLPSLVGQQQVGTTNKFSGKISMKICRTKYRAEGKVIYLSCKCLSVNVHALLPSQVTPPQNIKVWPNHTEKHNCLWSLS